MTQKNFVDLKPSFFGQFKGVYTTFYKALYKTL